AALLEAAVAEQGAGEVADADQRHRPFAVHAERPADGGDQFVRGVADAGVAEVAERGEVLAHLRVGDAERLAELAAGDLGDAVPQQSFEAAQVQAEPAPAGPRQPQFAAGAGLTTLAPGGIAFFAHAPAAERKMRNLSAV